MQSQPVPAVAILSRNFSGNGYGNGRSLPRTGIRMPKKLANALTALAVKNAGPGRHGDGGGLSLLVKPNGGKFWTFRAMIDGKSRDIGLGPAGGPDAVSLADARDRAADLRREVRAGRDPIAERERAKAEAAAAEQAARIAGITFREVAESFVRSNREGWRNAKHRQQWANTLETYVYPSIGALPIADVSTAHVVQILDSIWTAKPETASRVRGRIERVLDAAKARGYREGENPARWRGHLAQLLPPRKRLQRGHHAAMPFAEVPAFLVKLRSREATAARALEFAILTATRTSEVTGARWEEIDLKGCTWTVPAERMKATQAHRVPLSARAREILEGQVGVDPVYPFPQPDGGKPMSQMGMLMLLRRMGVEVTVHGFRSSFRDWAAERTAFPFEVAEMALAHAITNRAEAAYRRGDLFEKRRQLMTAWADFCAAPAIEGEGATVTAIRPVEAAA
jgi:integrase